MWVVFIFVPKQMKKILLISLLCSSVLLAGCGKSGQDMTFQQAYDVLKTQNIFTKEYPAVDTNKPLQDNTHIDFSLAATGWFSATWTVILSWVYNLPSGWAELDVDLEAKAFEPSFGGNITLSWAVHLVENSKKIYGMIKAFGLKPELSQWNVEWWVINALINTISKKRITLSAEEQTATITPYRKNVTEFFRQLHSSRNEYNFFKETEKTTIDGYTAYKLWWDTEWIKWFMKRILNDARNLWNPVTFDSKTLDDILQWIIDSPLEGYLIIKSKDHVVVRLDTIKTKDSGIFSFTYDKDWLSMQVKDNDNNIVTTANIQKKDKELAFEINIPNNNVAVQWYTQDEQEELYMTVTNKEFVLRTIIWWTSTATPLFTPTTITWSTPLSQIVEWFSILSQGMVEPQQ
jgi:hypothetical protein